MDLALLSDDRRLDHPPGGPWLRAGVELEVGGREATTCAALGYEGVAKVPGVSAVDLVVGVHLIEY